MGARAAWLDSLMIVLRQLAKIADYNAEAERWFRQLRADAGRGSMPAPPAAPPRAVLVETIRIGDDVEFQSVPNGERVGSREPAGENFAAR